MKCYLLLQDGSIFIGKTQDKENLLGKASVDVEGSIKIQCQTTGKYKLVVNSKNSNKGYVELSDVDFNILKEKLLNSKTSLAKIVTDSLPIEFHVYDLKTFIPVA